MVYISQMQITMPVIDFVIYLFCAFAVGVIVVCWIWLRVEK
jgi:hypothetical protein